MSRFAPLALLPLLAAAQPAQAEPACVPRAEVLQHLSQRYHETPVAIGVATNGGVLEVLAAKEGTSWTIIVTMPNGIACMVAAGRDWQNLPQAAHLDPGA